MRNQHGIQVRHRNARFRQTLAAGLTRINQHPRLTTLQKTRGTKPPTHRRAGSRAEEKQGIHKLCTSTAATRLDNKINPARVSNGSQFYVTLKPMPALNGQYTVFGRVLEGLEHLEEISRQRTDRNNFPLEKVVIKRTFLEPRAGTEPPAS
jgi:cyclophilin family peptidyl-prolyl cis-trans isomerase